MVDLKFGVGDQANSKAFATATVGKENPRTVELINGENPHSYSYNTHYARWPDGHTEAFSGHRIQVKIELETYNYLKESELSGDEVRKGGEGRIYLNGEQVTSFFFREIDYALLEARKQLDTIMEHPLQLWDADERKKIVGRKVYYQNVPAVVKYLMLDQGCVFLLPEQGHRFPIVAHEIETAKERGHAPDAEDRDSVKIEITSPLIWWWRK